MNVFSALFGIFRSGGLAEALHEGKPVGGFIIAGLGLTLICGATYGAAMGIGIDLETALKDAVKIAAVLVLSYVLALPVFLLAYRLLGREEPAGQIAATALAGVLSSALVLGVAAPVIFLYGVASGFAPELLYVHVALVDVAALLGVFMLGNLAHRAFSADRQRLIIPNVMGVIMIALVVVVSVNFFAPFLQPHPTFSEGTDRLFDSLGIGVAAKVERALRSASLTDRIEYRYQFRSPAEGQERDFTVIRTGDNYQITVRRLVRPGQPPVNDRRIWLLDGKAFTDTSGQVAEISRAELGGFLDEALPEKAFVLGAAAPLQFRARMEQLDGQRAYVARASITEQQVVVQMDARSQALVSFSVEDPAAPDLAGIRISSIRTSSLTSTSLQASLTRAMESIQNPSDPRFREAWETQMVVASLERPDPTSFDYINGAEYFTLRYLRVWQQLPWNASLRSVTFAACPNPGCARMTVEVSGLDRNKRLEDLLFDLRNQLTAQPRNRDVAVRIETLKGVQVGIVEHTFDFFEGGVLKTNREVQYWFNGRVNRYAITGMAPAEAFDGAKPVFASAAQSFEYLR